MANDTSNCAEWMEINIHFLRASLRIQNDMF